MNEKYLVINAGSSSLKFSLYEMPEEKEIVNGYHICKTVSLIKKDLQHLFLRI